MKYCSLLELLKEEQSVVAHIEQMRQEEKEIANDMMQFNCDLRSEDHIPTIETRKLETMLERRQRIVVAELEALDRELELVRSKMRTYIVNNLGIQVM